MTDQEKRAYIKANLSSVYGMMANKELTKEQRKYIRKTFREGATNMIYKDTDSICIVSKDNTLCMYDHATELLK